jgi:hypothetical protein
MKDETAETVVLPICFFLYRFVLDAVVTRIVLGVRKGFPAPYGRTNGRRFWNDRFPFLKAKKRFFDFKKGESYNLLPLNFKENAKV